MSAIRDWRANRGTYLMHVDTLIRGGTVIDGSGSPGFAGDIGLTDGAIAAIGDLRDVTAGETIDATDRVVAPGFIDVHIHSEIAIADRANLYRYGSVLQGVTTHLTAPDGFGWAPLAGEPARQLWDGLRFAYGQAPFPIGWPSPEEYLAIFPGNTPVNVVPQVPHCAVRMAVLGWDTRPPDADELGRMEDLTREWLDAGAKCLNLGLDYQPSAFATTGELIALSRVAREYDGLYAAHVRYNGLGRAAAFRETWRIGEEADIPVHISHERIDAESAVLFAEGEERCDVSFESYLYPAGCTHLALMLPLWAQAGGPDAIQERLRDPESRAKMRAALDDRLNNDPMRARAVCVDDQTGTYVGKEIQAMAAAEGIPFGELAIRILESEHPYALMVYHRRTTPEALRDEIVATLRHPKMMVASDGMYSGVSAHPRAYGCFGQAVRLGVREYSAVSLEQAIRKMSGYPAERFRIPRRGVLREGYGADVVILDPATYADQATWDEPRLEPVGVDRVIVNGETVVRGGVPTGALPGRVIDCNASA
jgi:N-acyl-D-amino-acid deacylase